MITAAPLPILPQPVNDWVTIGELASLARQNAGATVDDVCRELGTPPEDLVAFEAGEPVLAVYEIDALARMLKTKTGAWFCGDEPALFRGADTEAGAAAAEIGTQLMTEYLASQARGR